MKPRDRLRIAMQKSGRLTEPAQELLARCGLKFRQSRDKLFCFGEGEPVDLLLVRDDDIPGLIAEGVCDLGIVGRNVLREFQLSNPEPGEGLDELRWSILRIATNGAPSQETALITNLRQRQAVTDALAALGRAGEGVAAGLPHEVLLVDLYDALGALDRLTGATTADDILHLIFSSFCIGK